MKVNDLELLNLLAYHYDAASYYKSGPDTHHPYYRCIVRWGKENPKDIIPWLITKLDNNFFWVSALFEIVGPIESPAIIEELQGKVYFVIQIWKDWASARNYKLIVEPS